MLDVETTGLSPTRDRILELAMVTLDSRARVVAEFTTRLNPDGPVGATHIHGIRDCDVRDAPKFAQILPEVVRILKGAAVVAHNAPFDMKFLHVEFGRAGWDLPSLPTLCTLQASHQYLPNLPRRTLSDCCSATGVRHHRAHSALGDARATAALLSHFLNSTMQPNARIAEEQIVLAARDVRWPAGPTAPRQAETRQAPKSTAYRRFTSKTPSPELVTMVSRFSLLQAAEAGATDSMIAYLEKLADALSDGILTAREAADLAELAGVYGFTPDDVAAANRSFLLALAHEALQDGKVAQAERAELKKLAGLLDVDEKHVSKLLKRAEAERFRRLGAGLPALPEDWVLGEPLRVGDRVAFTGCGEQQRQRLEAASEQAGVRVMGNVSRLTTLLVSDGTVDGAKAAAAQEHGTRIVTPAHYDVLLRYLQPLAD